MISAASAAAPSTSFSCCSSAPCTVASEGSPMPADRDYAAELAQLRWDMEITQAYLNRPPARVPSVRNCPLWTPLRCALADVNISRAAPSSVRPPENNPLPFLLFFIFVHPLRQRGLPHLSVGRVVPCFR